jgi:putative addiction module CopG family antidote
MNVSLAKHQKDFVQTRVRAGEVVREALCVLENLEFDRDWLEAEIQKGIQSGSAIEVTGDYWEQFRKRLRSRIPKAVLPGR